MPESPPHRSPAEAILAATRLQAVALDAAAGTSPQASEALSALAAESQAFFSARGAQLLRAGAEIEAVVGSAGVHSTADDAVRIALPEPAAGHTLLLTGAPPLEPAAAEAFAAALAGALAQLAAAAEHAERLSRLQALTRATRTLNESLDASVLLTRICREAATVGDADLAAIYTGTAELVVSATYNLPAEMTGFVLGPGEGVAGQVIVSRRPAFTNDYQAGARIRPGSPFARVRAALAVPMEVDGELRGVLSLGYTRPYDIGDADVENVQTFAELAAAALRNASAHAGLAYAARTDGLTGCLNHAALHEGLKREAERAERGLGVSLAVILFDLDDFKSVNDEHGHLMGDEMLRRVGHALRTVTRAYDLAARYGGDEFALVCWEATEADAAEIAHRALQRIAFTLGDLAIGTRAHATAGVAEWSSGLSTTELLARADRALLFGKREGLRGGVHRYSTLPDRFRPNRFGRPGATRPPRRAEPGDSPAPAAAPPGFQEEAAAKEAERLRRRTRRLATASTIGTRLAAMTDFVEIAATAASEAREAFGFAACGLVPAAEAAPDPLASACVQERRPVRNAEGTRLAVPVLSGEELWGALVAEDPEAQAFDPDGAALLETIADQVGSALRSADLYGRLERAYLGTAEALAAALDAHNPAHARSARVIAEHAAAIGRRLGLSDPELRTLRFGAIFADIGTIAVPEAVLEKPGPLDAIERAAVQRHTEVGAQILAPVELLADVLPIVRHEHERWDGRGYPDGLAGGAIPLGARIVGTCAAHHAMRSDRPYRAAMTEAQARDELLRHAGTQFDPAVVETLLAVLDTASA